MQLYKLWREIGKLFFFAYNVDAHTIDVDHERLMSGSDGRVETSDSLQTPSERHRNTCAGHEKLIASNHYPSGTGTSGPSSKDKIESRDDGHNVMRGILRVSSNNSIKSYSVSREVSFANTLTFASSRFRAP